MDLDCPEAKIFPSPMNTLMGTNTHKCIPTSTIHYQQMDIISFHQMYIEKIIIEEEILNLKKYFNKIFDEMKYSKKLDVNSVKLKNDRLRDIQNEIKALNILKGIDEHPSFHTDDPKFLLDEIPESSVVQVRTNY